MSENLSLILDNIIVNWVIKLRFAHIFTKMSDARILFYLTLFNVLENLVIVIP